MKFQESSTSTVKSTHHSFEAENSQGSPRGHVVKSQSLSAPRSPRPTRSPVPSSRYKENSSASDEKRDGSNSLPANFMPTQFQAYLSQLNFDPSAGVFEVHWLLLIFLLCTVLHFWYYSHVHVISLWSPFLMNASKHCAVPENIHTTTKKWGWIFSATTHCVVDYTMFSFPCLTCSILLLWMPSLFCISWSYEYQFNVYHIVQF